MLPTRVELELQKAAQEQQMEALDPPEEIQIADEDDEIVDINFECE